MVIAQKSVLESKRLAVGFAITLICVGLFVAKLLIDSRAQAYVAEKRRAVSEDAFAIASAIERRFAFHEFVGLSLSSAVEINPDMDQARFSRLVAPFFINDPGILNLALETDWVVTHVYPFEPNRAVLGLDYRESTLYLPSVEEVRETSKPVLNGPFGLIQGIDGVILRTPVELPSRDGTGLDVRGSVAVVSSVASLLNLIATVAPDMRVSLEIIGGDGNLPLRVFGDPSVVGEQPVAKSVDIAGTQFVLNVVPENGWGDPTIAPVVVYASSLVVTMALLGLLFWARFLVVARRRSWQQLSDAIEAIDDGFALYDPEDRLVICNTRYKSYYNRSSHLMQKGATFSEIIWGGVQIGQYQDAIGNEEEWFAKRLAAHRNPTDAVEQHLDDGRWLKVSEAKLSDGSTVGFRVDVTNLKEAQQQAETANRAKTDFLNVVSHEIRTPLSAVIGFSTVLKNARSLPAFKGLRTTLDADTPDAETAKVKLDALIEDFASYASRIDSNAQHLRNIINDILYWNDIDSKDRPMDNRPVALNDILKSGVDQLSGLAGEKGLDLRSETTDAVVCGDPVRLHQVIVNLLGNAIKFTDCGSITVNVSETDGEVTIAVTDTGCGIPNQQRDRIFEYFFQVDSGLNRRFSGSGLGLAISRDIVKKHGGSITVSSELGQGSTFYVALPKYHAIEAAA